MSGDPLPVEIGDRARVRRYTMDDLDSIWTVVREERARLERWMPWVEETTTIDVQRAWLEKVIGEPEGLDGCGIFADDVLAGGIGLSWDPFRVAGEIGYWVGASFEGRGLVTEAAREMTRIGFDHVGLNRVVIRAGVDHRRSRSIPERLGYVLEGVARGDGKGSGGYYDIAVYAMLAQEWRDLDEPAGGREP